MSTPSPVCDEMRMTADSKTVHSGYSSNKLFFMVKQIILSEFREGLFNERDSADQHNRNKPAVIVICRTFTSVTAPVAKYCHSEPSMKKSDKPRQ